MAIGSFVFVLLTWPLLMFACGALGYAAVLWMAERKCSLSSQARSTMRRSARRSFVTVAVCVAISEWFTPELVAALTWDRMIVASFATSAAFGALTGLFDARNGPWE